MVAQLMQKVKGVGSTDDPEISLQSSGRTWGRGAWVGPVIKVLKANDVSERPCYKVVEGIKGPAGVDSSTAFQRRAL